MREVLNNNLNWLTEIERAHEKTTSATAGALNREVHSHGTEGLHSVIGLALVLGFIFMLLVDQIGSSRSRGKFPVNLSILMLN